MAAYLSHQVFPAVFGPRQCDRIVELGLGEVAAQGGPSAGGIEGLGDGDVPAELRRCSVAWLGEDDHTAWVHDKLLAVAERANRLHGFRIEGFGEDLQFATYDALGSHYAWHRDGLEDGVQHRKLTLVVQLSDPADYTGGDLELVDSAPDLGAPPDEAQRRARRRRGAVIAFPAFEQHRVTPLRDGCRHSLVAWMSGPPFA